MTNWKEYKLEDIAKKEKGAIKSGPFGSNISSKYFVESGIPVIRGNNLPNSMVKFNDSGFVFVTEAKAKELNCWATKNDLLFTAAGTIGQVGLLIGSEKHSHYVISNKQIKVSLDTSVVNPLFVYYWYSTPIMNEYIKNRNSGSTIPLINLTVVRNLPINLPDLPTQTAIAEILSSLDDKIEINNKINQELENLAQTLFKQWFIDFEFPNEKGEPYKSSGGELVDSELGEIPKGWEVGTFGDLCKVVNGYAFKSKDFSETGSNGILKIRNVNGSIVDILNTQFVSSDVVASVQEKFRVLTGHILIAMTGAEVGKTGIVPETNKSLWLNQRVGRFEPIIENTIVFIYHMFNVLNFTQAVRNSAMGSAQPNISASGIESLNCIIPPKEIILLFSSINQDSFNLTLKNLGENQELTNLRDTLLPKLISGELEVADIMAEKV